MLSLDEQAGAPAGQFSNVPMTKDVNPLEQPVALEYKIYAKGVGPVLVVGVSGGGGREGAPSLRARQGLVTTAQGGR